MSVSVSVNVHEAKTRLSQLLARAEAGEEVIISRAGTPVAKLSSIQPTVTERTLGLLEGEIWVADDFDQTPTELIELFYDSPKPDDSTSPNSTL